MTADLKAAAQQAFNLLDRLPINEGYHDETVEVLDALRAGLAAQAPAEGDEPSDEQIVTFLDAFQNDRKMVGDTEAFRGVALDIWQQAQRQPQPKGTPAELTEARIWDLAHQSGLTEGGDVRDPVAFARLIIATEPQPKGAAVAWRDPSNTDPGQGCTYDKDVADKWPHIYRQPLYDAPVQAPAPVAGDYKQALGSKNCMQSAVAYMLGLPMDAVPDFEKAGPDAWESFYAFISERGFTAEMFPPNVEIDGDYLASGSTERGTSHMVVMRGGKLLHDPHPSNAGLTSPQVVWVIARKAGPSPAVAHAAPEPIRCPERVKNGGTCPHHNLQCGWPACNKEAP